MFLYKKWMHLYFMLKWSNTNLQSKTVWFFTTQWKWRRRIQSIQNEPNKIKLSNVISGDQPIKFWKFIKCTSEYIIYYLLFFLVGLWKITLQMNNSLFFEFRASVLPEQTYWLWLFWPIPHPRHCYWTHKEGPSASRSGSRQTAPDIFWVRHRSRG